MFNRLLITPIYFSFFQGSPFYFSRNLKLNYIIIIIEYGWLINTIFSIFQDHETAYIKCRKQMNI